MKLIVACGSEKKVTNTVTNTVKNTLTNTVANTITRLFPHLVHPSRQEDQEQLLTPEKQFLKHLLIILQI